MRGNPLYDFPDYGYESSSDHPEIVILIFIILLVIYINRIINLKIDDYFINLIFTISASIILLSSFYIDNSPGFFNFLRILITLSSMVLLVLTLYYDSSRFVWLIRFLLLTILVFYNSVFPIYTYSENTWKIIDTISIIVLLSNNIYSYNIDKPFSYERRERIYKIKKSYGLYLEFLFPSEHNKEAGLPLLAIIYLVLMLKLFILIF